MRGNHWTRAALAAAVVLCVCSIAMAAGPSVAPPGSIARGHSYAEWQAEWWQWTFGTPITQHPLFDQTGANAYVGQHGDVWFLGGNFNPPPDTTTTTRNIVVPVGVALFFPVVDVECSNLEGGVFFGDSEGALRACVHRFDFLELRATVDGAPVRNLETYTQDSVLYQFFTPQDNIMGVPPGTRGTSMDRGVYLFVDRLEIGRHTIWFHGRSTGPDNPDGSKNDFTLDVTYNVTVVDAF